MKNTFIKLVKGYQLFRKKYASDTQSSRFLGERQSFISLG